MKEKIDFVQIVARELQKTAAEARGGAAIYPDFFNGCGLAFPKLAD